MSNLKSNIPEKTTNSRLQIQCTPEATTVGCDLDEDSGYVRTPIRDHEVGSGELFAVVSAAPPWSTKHVGTFCLDTSLLDDTNYDDSLEILAETRFGSMVKVCRHSEVDLHAKTCTIGEQKCSEVGQNELKTGSLLVPSEVCVKKKKQVV